MNMRFLFYSLLTLWCSAATGAVPGFYVWQREWTPEVIAAVQACPRPLYLLAGEFSGTPDKLQVDSVRIPSAVLARPDVTLVYRVHVGLLENFPFDRFVAEVRKNSIVQIQLDVDCPEKKLALYERLLLELRRRLPERRFSLTALPCHLNRPEFFRLVRLADYYVLQLHGLYVPRNIGDDRRLIRREDALPALALAMKAATPFKLALPTYAYQLNFDRSSGRFLSLNAERIPVPSERISSGITTIDFNLLHDILQTVSPEQIIWFRLPVESDMLNLDMATVKRLETGAIPKPSLEFYCRRIANKRWDLFVRNNAGFGFGAVTVKLRWAGREGEYDLFGGTGNRSANCAFGVLPDCLEVRLPGCGRESRCASFFVDDQPMGIEIQ